MNNSVVHYNNPEDYTTISDEYYNDLGMQDSNIYEPISEPYLGLKCKYDNHKETGPGGYYTDLGNVDDGQNNKTSNLKKNKTELGVLKGPDSQVKSENFNISNHLLKKHAVILIVVVLVLGTCAVLFFSFAWPEINQEKLTEANYCKGRPCLNNGSCENTVSGFDCSCQEGYYGNQCQKNYCDRRPCLNDGICLSTKGGYNCSCLEGYSGNHCERTPCSNSPCMNGGTCRVSGGTYSCSCNKRFDGNRCQSLRTCSYGWIQHGDKCYDFNHFNRDWADAKSRCEEYNSYLAEPKTSSEIAFLRSEARSRGHTYWLGATDRQWESSWRWEHSRSWVTITDWHTRTIIEPNNADGNEDCLAISHALDYEWNDDKCSRENDFICEKKLY